MPIEWNLLNVPNIGETFSNAYKQGQEQRALTDYARAPDNMNALNALAPFKPDYVVQQKQAMAQQAAKKQEEMAARRAEVIGQAAQWADTPEKWDAAIDHLSQQFPELAQYKGHFSPEARMSAIAAAGQMKDYFANQRAQMEANKAVLSGPGTEGRDPVTGALKWSTPFAPRPVTVGPDQTVVEYQPGQAGGAAAALKTNPGALKDSPFARSQPGYTGNSGGFATFATPEQGIAAQEALLRGAYVNKGFNTIDKIVNRYAPQGPENSGASVNNYKAYIAQRTGIDVNQPISAADVPKVAAAMREFETGNKPGGARVIAQGGAKPGYGAPVTNPPGLPPGTYQMRPDGKYEPVGGGSSGGFSKQQVGAAKAKISSLKAIEGQLARVENADKALQAGGFGGPVWGRIPGAGSLDTESAMYDKAIAQLAPLIRQLTRTPGEGAMSDYESRLAQLAIPARSDKPEVRAEAYAGIRELIANIKAGYQEMLGGQASSVEPAAPAANRPSVSNW